MLDIGRCMLRNIGYWVPFAGGLDAYEGPSSSPSGVEMAAAVVDKGEQLVDGSRINTYRLSMPGCSRLTLCGLHVKVASLKSTRHRGALSTLDTSHTDHTHPYTHTHTHTHTTPYCTQILHTHTYILHTGTHTHTHTHTKRTNAQTRKERERERHTYTHTHTEREIEESRVCVSTPQLKLFDALPFA
jgi:hypothetical protein